MEGNLFFYIRELFIKMREKKPSQTPRQQEPKNNNRYAINHRF